MAVTATPALPQAPQSSKVQILPADASNLKTIYTGGANGSKIVACIVTSTDTVARDVQIGITRGGTFYPLTTITIPITAGTINGTRGIDMFAPGNCVGLPIDNDGQPYIFLSSASDTFQAKSLTTVTAAKEIDINSFGADF